MGCRKKRTPLSAGGILWKQVSGIQTEGIQEKEEIENGS
jgi:hypothetical protein